MHEFDFDDFTRYITHDMELENHNTDQQWSVFSKWYSEEEWDQLKLPLSDCLTAPSQQEFVPTIERNISPPPEEQQTTTITVPIKAVAPPNNSSKSTSAAKEDSSKQAAQSFEDQTFHFPPLVLPKQGPTFSLPANTDDNAAPILVNAKGKPKSDHELREEFYRREFRNQTGGRDPPRFYPTRSAYDESFVWRPDVNKTFSIHIPLYRRLDGQLDDAAKLQARIRKRVRPKGMEADHITQWKKVRVKGDIAYYFMRARYVYTNPDTDEEEEGEFEEFEPGDVVAVLSDGTVTKDTNADNVQFVSVVPGAPGDPISPWKILPDPAPEDVELYQAVVVLGIAYVKLNHPFTHSVQSCVLIPSGNGDGLGQLVERTKLPDRENRFSHVVGLPIENSQSEAGDETEVPKVMIIRNGQMYQPIIDSLMERMSSLDSQSEVYKSQIQNLSDRIEQLQSLVDEKNSAPDTASQHLNPKQLEIVELFPSRLLILSHRKRSVPCGPLHDVRKRLPELWDRLAKETGHAIVTVPWMPTQVMSSVNPDGTVEEITGVICLDVIGEKGERRVFGFQKRDCWRDSDVHKLARGEFHHRLNGTFCEFTVDGRFCMRLMRVVRIPNLRGDGIIKALFKCTGLGTVKKARPSRRKRYQKITRRVIAKIRDELTSSKEECKVLSPEQVDTYIQKGSWTDLATKIVQDTHCITEMSNDNKQTVLLALRACVQDGFKEAKLAFTEYEISIDAALPHMDASLEENIAALARYWMAMQTSEDLKAYHLEAIIFATDNNPFMAWYWAVYHKVNLLRKHMGWSENVQREFPNTREAILCIQLYDQLLQYGPIMRKLGSEVVVPQATASHLITREDIDPRTIDYAYRILSYFARDTFLRSSLLQYESIKNFFADEYEAPLEYRSLIEKIKHQLRIMPFTGVYAADDISSCVPFQVHLPCPDPTCHDNAKNLLLMITFQDISLYTTEDLITFWLRFPLPCDITDVRRPLHKRFLTLEFLDNGSLNTSECGWNMKFVYRGKLYDTIFPAARRRTPESHLWIFTCSLRESNLDEDTQALWLQDDVPDTEDLVMVFRASRSKMKEVCTIAFASLQID